MKTHKQYYKWLLFRTATNSTDFIKTYWIECSNTSTNSDYFPHLSIQTTTKWSKVDCKKCLNKKI